MGSKCTPADVHDGHVTPRLVRPETKIVVATVDQTRLATLGSAFALAGLPGYHEEDGSGTFVLAIDPGLLAGKDEYMERSTELIKHIKSAKPLAGQKVVLPGEQGDAIAKQAEDSGEIEIADAIWDQLTTFVEA